MTCASLCKLKVAYLFSKSTCAFFLSRMLFEKGLNKGGFENAYLMFSSIFRFIAMSRPASVLNIVS